VALACWLPQPFVEPFHRLCCVPRDRACAVRLLACELDFALLPSRDLPSPASASHPM
jgi:hypothetical protein